MSTPTVKFPTLFGTDGVRGTPGTSPLDEQTLARLGAAVVSSLPRLSRVLVVLCLAALCVSPWIGPSMPSDSAEFILWQLRVPRVLVGRDTREAGPWITQQLLRGLTSGGAEVTDGSLMSTPAIAFLTKECGFDAGIVVSASHNPFQDNGIKIFTRAGRKADVDLEVRLAELPFHDTRM